MNDEIKIISEDYEVKEERFIRPDPWRWEWDVKGFSVRLVEPCRDPVVFTEGRLLFRLDDEVKNASNYATHEAHAAAIRKTRFGLSLFRGHWNDHLTGMLDDLEEAVESFDRTGDGATEVETLFWKIDRFLDEGPETSYDVPVQARLDILRPIILRMFERWEITPDPTIW